MNDPNAHPDDAHLLTRMFDLGFDGSKHFEPEELGAILQHQLAAPLECDLGRFDRAFSAKLQAVEGSPINSFADLLHHPAPPVDLLELAKRFAKVCRTHRDSPLPDEIATVLYFLCIAVALSKCGRRTTRMDDSSLRYSLDWALKQSWLDESTRRLLHAGRQAIDSSATG